MSKKSWWEKIWDKAKIVLAFLTIPITILFIILSLRERDNSSMSRKDIKKQKKIKNQKVEENNKKISELEKYNKALEKTKEELKKEREKLNEKADTITIDIDNAKSLKELECIRRRINEIE